MSTSGRYPVPAETCRVEGEVRRSRFITTVGPAATVEEAREGIGRVRLEFADASHNCWAYLVGPPGSSGRVGMSDDGEPHGTAGRPMLNALLHSGVGDIMAVVTRYFGGTKLGKGGLVRAYSGGVQAALQALRLAERVAYTQLRVVIDYASVTGFKRMLTDFEAEVEAEDFGADVTVSLRLPRERAAPFKDALVQLTGGRAIVEAVENKD